MLYYITKLNLPVAYVSLFMSSSTGGNPEFLNLGVKTLSAFVVGNIAKSYHTSLSKEQNDIIIQKSSELLTDGNNGSKILTLDNGKEIIQNLSSDLIKMTESGSNKIISTISESVSILFSLPNLINVAPGSLLFSILPTIPIQKLLNYKIEKISEDKKQLSATQTEIIQNKADIFNNIDKINLRDGNEFIKDKYELALSEESRINKQLGMNDIEKNLCKAYSELVNSIMPVIYFLIDTSYSVLNGNMLMQRISSLPILQKSSSALSSFFSSNINNKIENIELVNSTKHVEQLLEAIAQHNDKLNYSTNNEGLIKFDNYSLKLGDEKLVSTEHLEFRKGKHYA
ncbi:MAG: hypothetical protein EOP34_11615, partial [Rickettsiales bacterium]